MNAIRTASLLAASCIVAACVPRQAPRPPVVVAPPPAPVAPVVRPAPTPPPPPPTNLAWTDAPLTPGNWTYRPAAQGSFASYGPATTPYFLVRCFGGGQVQLSRPGAAANSLTFRTSSMARTVNAAIQPEGATATLPASDLLLDALVFSRGRFAVEAPGATPLVVPAWPELARVVEDCRRGR